MKRFISIVDYYLFFESTNNTYEPVYRDKNVEKIFAVYFHVVKKKYAKTRENETVYHWLFMTDHASYSFINQICLG